MIKVFADENIEGQRLDAALASILENFSRSKIQGLIKKDLVKVNGVLAKASLKIKFNDVIEIDEPLETSTIFEAQNIEFEIVYEDENMVVVNKPSGILTHPTTVEKTGTLVNGLLYKLGENLSDINGEFYILIGVYAPSVTTTGSTGSAKLVLSEMYASK